MKRKIRVWGKFNLFEASAVGLPAYPDAHASVDSFSLVKSLNASLKKFVGEGETIDQLNLEEKEAMVENQESAPVEETKAETNVDTKATTPEAKPEVTSEIAKAIADGIKEGFKELSIERGVVEKQVPPKKKSLGEMAIEQTVKNQGLFVTR